jgi:hypothetical protein
MSTGVVRSSESRSLWRGRALAIAIVVGGLVLVFAANAHLIYLAFKTQPECVAHIKEAGSGPPGARYAPARSSC